MEFRLRVKLKTILLASSFFHDESVGWPGTLCSVWMPVFNSSASGVFLLLPWSCWVFFQPISPFSHGKYNVSIRVTLYFSMTLPWWFSLTGLSWRPYMLGSDCLWPPPLLPGTISQAHLLLTSLTGQGKKTTIMTGRSQILLALNNFMLVLAWIVFYNLVNRQLFWSLDHQAINK